MSDSAAREMVLLALEPLAPALAAPDVIEVCVNRPGEMYVETRAGWRCEAVPALTELWGKRFAATAATWSAQQVNEARPVLSATLPGGERVQIVIPPATPAGTISVTIRKPSSVSMGLDRLGSGGLFVETRAAVDRAGTAELLELYREGRWEAFLRAGVKARLNILISGATGSGKTTLSKALIAEIPYHERILTIEDTPELEVPQPNHVRLYYSMGGQGVSKAGPKELLESALRMRPDRILLQELRDGTAFYYIRNVNSGHPGSITTVHADSCALAFEQMTLLVKESDGGVGLARDDIRGLLRQLVDVVVQCQRVGGAFRVTEIDYAAARCSPAA